MTGFFYGYNSVNRSRKESVVFTGIVQDLVAVKHIEHSGDISHLCLDLGNHTKGLQLGASVAVNGVCLTVTQIEQSRVYFDIIKETISTTNLGQLHADSLVNVERSFTIGTEVGGHIVSGHVSGTAQLMAHRAKGHDHVVQFAVDADWQKYIFHKGFVAVDGASLTVSARSDTGFEISLIPETLARTTLGRISVGDFVNVEVDGQTVTTVETVERLLNSDQWQAKFTQGNQT